MKKVNAPLWTLIMAQNIFCQNMHPFKCHESKFYLSEWNKYVLAEGDQCQSECIS